MKRDASICGTDLTSCRRMLSATSLVVGAVCDVGLRGRSFLVRSAPCLPPEHVIPSRSTKVPRYLPLRRRNLPSPELASMSATIRHTSSRYPSS